MVQAHGIPSHGEELLVIVVVLQYVQLWQIMDAITLLPGVANQHIWMAHPSGSFTTKSAYEHYFIDAIEFEPHRRLWKSWAPLRIKMFILLAIVNRRWLDAGGWRPMVTSKGHMLTVVVPSTGSLGHFGHVKLLIPATIKRDQGSLQRIHVNIQLISQQRKSYLANPLSFPWLVFVMLGGLSVLAYDA